MITFYTAVDDARATPSELYRQYCHLIALADARIAKLPKQPSPKAKAEIVSILRRATRHAVAGTSSRPGTSLAPELSAAILKRYAQLYPKGGPAYDRAVRTNDGT